MSSAYRIASPFLIRLAGVPFDVLEELATPELRAAARDLIAQEAELTRISHRAEEFVTRRDNGLGPEEFSAWRSAIRRRQVPEKQPIPEELRDYSVAVKGFAAAGSRLDRELQAGVAAARRCLFASSARLLPGYLVFGSGQAHHLMDLPGSGEKLPPRTSRARERERHLLLYLQRMAAKNDTFSEWGPSAWGSIGHGELRFVPSAGISHRQVFPERWVALTFADLLRNDPEIFPELRPRLNPNGRLVGDKFVFTDTAETSELTAEQMEVVAHCDGATTVRELLKCQSHVIQELVEKKILIAAIEVPAMEPLAFEVLRGDVAAWHDPALREHWLAWADAVAELAKRFGETSDAARRSEIMSSARNRLASSGTERKAGARSLYAAVNPIAEECYRECEFEIDDALLDEVVSDAEPWIDLWRDSYAFIAARVAANLRALLEKARTTACPGSRAGCDALPLPAFLRFCEAAKVPLTGPGLVGMAHIAFHEIKAAFSERLRPHAQEAEYELTAEDCAVVRRNFRYPKFDEFTYPSADLQLAAASTDAVNRGDYRWIIGELHPAAATLHHCMWWSCPDKPALSRALRSMIKDKPVCHFGFFAADFTAHTTVRVFEALPQHAIFVSSQRADARWRCVPPSEAEVFVDAEGDVGLRRDGEYLGSFARNWVIPLGFHPFLFTITPHTPRLRCGRVIVQRRAWSVSAEELGAGDFSGVSAALVIAIERLRAEKGWPRFIYIRPSEQALRRSGAENRDKDTKPVFIDLESYLFLEIFHRWLTKAGELEVTEMLPAPDELLWHEADGRRTFELRTLICPRPC